MNDAQRSWLRWVGTATGIVLVLVGLRTILVHGAFDCHPSETGTASACNFHAPTHPHLLLGLLIVALGAVLLVGSRRYLAHFGRTRH
jgi:hypothetical protein